MGSEALERVPTRISALLSALGINLESICAALVTVLVFLSTIPSLGFKFVSGLPELFGSYFACLALTPTSGKESTFISQTKFWPLLHIILRPQHMVL